MPSSEPLTPANFTARSYQRPFLDALADGASRAILVWHRRAGKDKACYVGMLHQASRRRGNYLYLFPTYTQAKKALWNVIDAAGFRTLEHCPRAWLAKDPNESEMLLTLRNGSTIQLAGADTYDRLVGANPVGVVFSEYSLTNPRAWDYLRPILAENGGWAVFNGTPRGENHFAEMYEMAEDNPAWFVSRQTVDDTGVAVDLDAERAAGMSEDLIRQEFYCDFQAANEGAYYGRLIVQAREQGRIARVPYQPALPVHTAWDLGVGDATAIWFFQMAGAERHYIDYYEASGEGLPHYAKVLQDRGYVYGQHYAPHDAAARELGTGKSRVEIAQALGLRFVVVPAQRLEDQIEAVRAVLPVCWFDAERCRQGIAALRAYHKRYDEVRKAFSDRPAHDWSSHGAGGFATGVLGYRPVVRQRPATRRVPNYARG